MSDTIYYRHLKLNTSRALSGHCHSAETFACSLTGLSHPSLFRSQQADYDRSPRGSPTDGLSTLRLARTLGQRHQADKCLPNRQVLLILSHLEAGLQEPATTPGDDGCFKLCVNIKYKMYIFFLIKYIKYFSILLYFFL